MIIKKAERKMKLGPEQHAIVSFFGVGGENFF
jgi:hypothetical protein